MQRQTPLTSQRIRHSPRVNKEHIWRRLLFWSLGFKREEKTPTWKILTSSWHVRVFIGTNYLILKSESLKARRGDSNPDDFEPALFWGSCSQNTQLHPYPGCFRPMNDHGQTSWLLMQRNPAKAITSPIFLQKISSSEGHQVSLGERKPCLQWCVRDKPGDLEASAQAARFQPDEGAGSHAEPGKGVWDTDEGAKLTDETGIKSQLWGWSVTPLHVFVLNP